MKIPKILKIVALVLVICLCFSGCMDTQNLKDLTIVQAIGVDVDEDNTKVTLQYLNLAKSGSATDALNGNITTTANGSATNISDAISTAAKSLSQKIFFGQNKLVIFGSEYSKAGIDKGLDYLLRSVDSRPDVLVAMSEERAQDIINCTQNNARIPAESVYQLLKIGQDNGLGAVVTVNDLLNMYSDKTSDIYLPVLKTNDKSAVCQGIMTFSNSKSAKMLNEKETFGFLFIKNKINGGSLTVTDEKFGLVGVEIVGSKTKCFVSTSDDKITFNCEIKLTIMLNELERGITNDLDAKKIKDISSLVNSQVSDMCTSSFYACTKNYSDPYMIGRYLAKANPTLYNSLKENWRQALPDVIFSVSVKTTVKNVNDNAVRE